MSVGSYQSTSRLLGFKSCGFAKNNKSLALTPFLSLSLSLSPSISFLRLAKGVAGVIVKPAVSVLDIASDTSSAVKNFTRKLMVTHKVIACCSASERRRKAKARKTTGESYGWGVVVSCLFLLLTQVARAQRKRFVQVFGPDGRLLRYSVSLSQGHAMLHKFDDMTFNTTGAGAAALGHSSSSSGLSLERLRGSAFAEEPVSPRSSVSASSTSASGGGDPPPPLVSSPRSRRTSFFRTRARGRCVHSGRH